MKIKLTNEQIREALDIESPAFPKYVTQIINLANQNAQGTRPKVVGQPGITTLDFQKYYVVDCNTGDDKV